MKTGCFATLFPKDYTQDVSFTIRCGHGDGYDLNDFLDGKGNVLLGLEVYASNSDVTSIAGGNLILLC